MNDHDKLADELQAICARFGLEDRREMSRRASFAKWDIDRLRLEAYQDGGRERFAAAVETGIDLDLDRRVLRQMRIWLTAGPQGLAAMPVAQLAKLTSDDRLAAIATDYDPFKTGGRLVCGPTGTGKSVAGVATLRRVHGFRRADMTQLGGSNDRGGSRGWVRAFDLPNARLAHGLGDGEAPAVSEAIAAQFLVLDDLGWESKRAGADDVVAEVIAARYDAGRITYATTGLKFEQFEERYGSAVVRRITDVGGLKGSVVNLWPADTTWVA